MEKMIGFTDAELSVMHIALGNFIMDSYGDDKETVVASQLYDRLLAELKR